jgi:hypothetical protein
MNSGRGKNGGQGGPPTQVVRPDRTADLPTRHPSPGQPPPASRSDPPHHDAIFRRAQRCELNKSSQMGTRGSADREDRRTEPPPTRRPLHGIL